MLQDLNLLNEEEGVRERANVTTRPILHAGFGRPDPAELVGAEQRAQTQIAFVGRVADVEGNEQVRGGVKRVIHRSDRPHGVPWDGHARSHVGEIGPGVIGIAGRGGLGDGDPVEREAAET
jgi:hypothetical protein